MDGLDWILLRSLVLLEHLAVLKINNGLANILILSSGILLKGVLVMSIESTCCIYWPNCTYPLSPLLNECCQYFDRHLFPVGTKI